MFQKLEEVFRKPTPLAEVYSTNTPANESEFYFRLLSDYGIRLNLPQKEAVQAVDGPLLLIAGAGSGKTTVLTSRIGYMIHTKNINPSNILLVTFTKKASSEMIERLARIPGMSYTDSRSVVAGTYHSICLRILRAEGYKFRVLSSERRKHIIIKTILKQMGLQEEYSAEAVASMISMWKNAMIRPQDLDNNLGLTAATTIKDELKHLYKRYEEIKESEEMYDFDDMLLETYYLLTFEPSVLKKYQQQFQYILCDEFQDTSLVQYEIIKLLAAPHNNLCVVGDDSQTIYSYRGASASYMIDFDKIYPNSRKIIMDINYRSGPAVVGLGNTIIHHNVKQIKKTLKVSKAENHAVVFTKPEDSDQEAERVVQDILEKQALGVPLKEIAVIYRTHATGRAIFDRLVLKEIPFVTYGKSNDSFYENTYIKPILSLLRVANNLSDLESLVDASPIFYIKRNNMQAVIDEVVASYYGNLPKDLFTQVMKRLADTKKDYQQKALLMKMNAVRQLSKMTAAQAIREIRCGSLGYEKQLELDERKTFSIHKEMLAEMLDECEQASRRFESISTFLAFVEQVEEKNAEMEELRKYPDIEAVRLMTIHASKGLEFSTVYAIGWVEGILPHAASMDTEKREDSQLQHNEAIEEERRLAYVCVTRAKGQLCISAPKKHRNKEAEVSRFLLEGLNIINDSNSEVREK